MENRIFIGSRKDTISFFADVKRFGNFLSYSEIEALLNVGHGSFWYLQTGKRSLSQYKFDLLNERLPLDMRQKYFKLLITKPANWGAVIGGHITYSKLKDKFDEGRKKAQYSSTRRAESRFNINQELTSDICEFLGAFAGDGFTNGTKSHYIIGFAGDSRYDRKYYDNKIIPITKKYFNIEKHHFRIEKNCMWINLYSLALHKMITERFKMPAGEKWNKVLVPDEIMQGKLEHKLAFVRGVFDTDGCVFFDSRPSYKEPYMRVDITMVNVPILTQLHQILTEAGIPSKVLGNGKHLHVTSKQDVRKFFEIVGSSNERHIAKIEKKYSDFRQWNPAFKINVTEQKSLTKPILLQTLQ